MLHHRKRVCGGQEKEISRKTCNIAQIKYNSFGDTLYLKGFPFFSFLGARSLRSDSEPIVEEIYNMEGTDTTKIYSQHF